MYDKITDLNQNNQVTIPKFIIRNFAWAKKQSLIITYSNGRRGSFGE